MIAAAALSAWGYVAAVILAAVGDPWLALAVAVLATVALVLLAVLADVLDDGRPER